MQEYHKSGYIYAENFLMSGGTDDINFIIHHTQDTYYDNCLWYAVIKFRFGLDHGPRFCLLSSYGHPLFDSPS